MTPMSEYEREQVDLKKRELTLKEDELAFKKSEKKNEWRKELWTAAAVGVSMLAVAVSIVAALLSYRGSLEAQRNQANAQMKLQEKAAQDAFELKAAEIAMSGRGSFDAKGRAKALSALFKGRLPDNLGSTFDPAEHSWGRDSKRELLSLLAAVPNAEHRRTLVRVYRVLLPEDDAIKRLCPDDPLLEKQGKVAIDCQ